MGEMTDIVERLRAVALQGSIGWEAADEIERLRDQLNKSTSLADMTRWRFSLQQEIDAKNAEIERLRATIADYQTTQDNIMETKRYAHDEVEWLRTENKWLCEQLEQAVKERLP
jgi:HAMP domain-containing protein